MIARILPLLVGLAFVGAACLSNPTPHPAKPHAHEADPSQTGTVIDPNDRDDDPTANMTTPTPGGGTDCEFGESGKYDGADVADATGGDGDATEGETQAGTQGEVEEPGCDAGAGTDGDTGPEASAPAASDFGQVHDP